MARKKFGGALFVCLDMAHLATVRTFPLRSLLLLAWNGSGAGRGPGRASTSSVGGRCRSDSLGFFAGEASFAVSFEPGKFNGKSRREDSLARRTEMLMAWDQRFKASPARAEEAFRWFGRYFGTIPFLVLCILLGITGWEDIFESA
jgi:hypothetical protein